MNKIKVPEHIFHSPGPRQLEVGMPARVVEDLFETAWSAHSDSDTYYNEDGEEMMVYHFAPVPCQTVDFYRTPCICVIVNLKVQAIVQINEHQPYTFDHQEAA